MKYESKKSKQLERIVRGFSNHRRIEIVKLLGNHPELSVVEISDILKVDYKTVAAHIERLAIAGLVLKRCAGAAVRHKLSDRGNVIRKFLRTLE